MRIASLCGSLGPGSANAAALSAATATLARRGVEVVAVDGLDEVPAFRADCVDDPRRRCGDSATPSRRATA
ncbi:MAG: hypothetical protein ACXVJS_10860 [Acidimicrobiia bacterium]